MSADKSPFTEEQQTRIEALRVASELRPYQVAGIFGQSASTPAGYVGDVIVLAEWILDGAQEGIVETFEPHLEEALRHGHFVPIGLAPDMDPRLVGEEILRKVREHMNETAAADQDEDDEIKREFAKDSEIERHTLKHDVSWSDAWRYFEREGYDMSEATGQYDRIVSDYEPEPELAQNDEATTITTTKEA